MYGNIGGKVKGLARFIFVLGCIIGAVSMIILFCFSEISALFILYGILSCAITIVLFWILSWKLYAIGEAADSSENAYRNTLKTLTELHSQNQMLQELLDNSKIQYKMIHEIRYGTEKQTTAQAPASVQTHAKAPVSADAPIPAEASTQKYTHKWICPDCGELISAFPCPKCGVSKAKTNVPIKLYPNADGIYYCPTCKNSMPRQLSQCPVCNQQFITDYDSTPFWCGKCGNPGPYVGNCPKCGSSMKVLKT